jgi:uncharacterized protein
MPRIYLTLPSHRHHSNHSFCMATTIDNNFNFKNVKSIQWNPSSSASLNDEVDNENIDAVVNLAGENIFGRWTKKKKKRIFDSRVNATKSLCKLLSSLDKPPKVLVSASATGYYGDRGDDMLTEESRSSVGFLSDLCKDWEEATQIAKESGIRVVNLRLGIVLSSSGGMLSKILPLFKVGLGGRIGNGNEYMSWIGLDDLLGLILYTIVDETISGPINAVSPNPITNADFTMTLGKVLSRPTMFSIPKSIIKSVLGEELAESAILSSTRVIPKRLIKVGYQFRFSYLESVLEHTLGKSIS